jgi:RNA polymerase sigma-70 factor, ECF subfamily
MMMDVAALSPPSRVAALRESRLRRVVEAHYDVVWRFTRRMGVADAHAEDAVQQVLVVFARRLDQVDEGAERAFLLGTALRVAADFRKQHARRREVSDDERTEKEASRAEGADDELDLRRKRRVLDDLLGEMPTELREVLVLCDLEEVTMAEASKSLDVPAGTVASRLKRARELFARLAGEARARIEKGEAR